MLYYRIFSLFKNTIDIVNCGDYNIFVNDFNSLGIDTNNIFSIRTFDNIQETNSLLTAKFDRSGKTLINFLKDYIKEGNTIEVRSYSIHDSEISEIYVFNFMSVEKYMDILL